MARGRSACTGRVDRKVLIQRQEGLIGIEIFRRKSGATDTWLVINDDDSATHVTENSGWRTDRRGMEKKESSMTVKEAKQRWSSYAEHIDEVLATFARKHANGGGKRSRVLALTFPG